MADQSKRQAVMTKIITKAWSDPEYKARLKADPSAALAEAGVNVPKNVTVQVHEETDSIVHLVLPPSPAEGVLSDEDLENIAGGKSGSGSWCPGCNVD